MISFCFPKYFHTPPSLLWSHLNFPFISYHPLPLISTDRKLNSALLPDRPFKRRFRFVFIIFRRIGREIAFNVYSVAVMYVRFAILTLVLYLMAHLFFREIEMVAEVQKSATGAAESPRIPSSTPSPPPSSRLDGDLWYETQSGVGWLILRGQRDQERISVAIYDLFIMIKTTLGPFHCSNNKNI